MSNLPPLSEILPHSAPMILLDEVVEWRESTVACEVTLRHDSMFVERGRVPAAVALEYMAQSIGAYAGLHAHARGEPRPMGFLLGSRQMRLELDHFEVGDTLRVEATRVWGEDQLGQFDCAVFRAGRKVAWADLKVYQSGDEELPS